MKENFYTALPLVTDLYGIEMDEDQFETLGMIAWNKIGNKDYELNIATLHPIPSEDGHGWYVDKPCDLDRIEAITLPFEDCKTTSAISDYPETYYRPIENWIESNKKDPNALYISGKFVKYTETADRIYFSEPFNTLNILYKRFVFDEDGLPYINEKEKEAIAVFCAYSALYKKGLATKDAGTIQLAQMLKKDWMQACSQARTPEYLSQNTAQEILDVMHSYDRHLFGKTSKVIK